VTKRILIIEDNTELSDILAMHLRDLHYEVDVEGDGKAGLALAEASPYDLIILDIMLPGMDGIEICRKLRNREDLRSAQTIMSQSPSVFRNCLHG
jgi:DNA-binding response OmpR family regulator